MVPSTIELLKLFDERTKLSLYDASLLFDCAFESCVDPFITLRNNNYIRLDDPRSGQSSQDAIAIEDKYRITSEGSEFLQKYESNLREKHSSSKRYWITWGLTTAIALAGLINSILARLGM